jgi:hypothetical protein
MRVIKILALLGFSCFLHSASGHVQGLKAVRPIPGYICMLLTPEDELATVQSQLPPVLAAPSPTAQIVGYPTGTVFVKWPSHNIGGYAEMLRLNWQVGWIDASHLRPWHPMNNQNGKCVPSVMSDGNPGFGG